MLCNPFITQSHQVNWFLSQQISRNYEWIFRIDSDEIPTLGLLQALNSRLANIPVEVCGLQVRRSIYFLGKQLRYGGVSRVKTLRIFRPTFARSSDRLMDEHIEVSGRILDINELLVDHNLRGLDFWLSKHILYAKREVAERHKSACNSPQDLNSFAKGKNAYIKDIIRRKLYYKFPSALAPIIYFLLRYFLLLGFLDGLAGFYFHFFQALWYRITIAAFSHSESNITPFRHKALK